MNSFIENVNYVAGLDNLYGSRIELYKNNLSLKSVPHDIELKFSYYNNDDKKIHSIIHSEPGVLAGGIANTLLSFKTLVESSITGSEFTCTVSSANNIVVTASINIVSNTDTYKTYKLEMKIVTDGVVTYDVFGEVGDSLKILPSLAMITASDVDAIANVYEIKEKVVTVSENIAIIETVSDSITNVNATGTNIANVNIVGEDITNVNTVSTHISNVDVAAIGIANIDIVATSIDNVTIASSNIANINTVANAQNLADIIRVADDLNSLDVNGIADITIVANDLVLGVDSNIITVSESIGNVNITGNNINNINTVGTDIANVNSVAIDLTNVDIVAGKIANVNITGNNIADVNTVSDSIASVNTVSGSISNVNTISANIAGVNIVGSNIAVVNTVANNITDVGIVANVNTDVTTVADSIGSVNVIANDLELSGTSLIEVVASGIAEVLTVGANIASVNSVAANETNINSVVSDVIPMMSEILLADDRAASALASANNADDSETLAHKWAQEPENVPVVGTIGVDGEYSAYHWAKKAEAAVGGNITLDSLYDVNTAGIVNGGMIRYNTATSTWNSYDFTNNDVIGLDTTANVTVGVGQIAWNATERTADLGLPGGSTLQIGQEDTRTVRNGTASTIDNGTVCMFAGTIGNSGRIKVAPYAGIKGTHKYIYGVATQTIAPGSDGLITIAGKVRGIDTTGSLVGEVWADEDILYVKPNDNGRLTNVEPGEGELKIVVATVIHAHTSGILEVRVLPIDENMSYTREQSNSTFVPLVGDFTLDLGGL